MLRHPRPRHQQAMACNRRYAAGNYRKAPASTASRHGYAAEHVDTGTRLCTIERRRERKTRPPAKLHKQHNITNTFKHNLWRFSEVAQNAALHASPTSAALAASLQTSGFQDIQPCLSFFDWHRSCVPSWRMQAGYRRWLPSSAVCWQSNVLGQEIMHPV